MVCFHFLDRMHLTLSAGPYPPAKFPTNITRASENVIQPSLLFFRTSQASRASPRFLRENAIIPPICYAVCLETLRSLPVEIHIADTEGDPYAVELAGRLGGYVTGRDSDFVILTTDGYRGYIPLDEMIWTTTETAAEEGPEDDGGFVVARTSKANKKATTGSLQRGQGVIPPDGTTDLTLTCSIYTPLKLATHLKLPITLLPLLASLVGNDFTPDRPSMQWQFFERDMTVSQRITRVAAALHSIVSQASSSPQKRRVKRPIASVIDLIDLAIEALLLRPSAGVIGSGEREIMVEKTVEAALQYAIPKTLEGVDLWPTPACALHLPEQCLLVNHLSPPVTSAMEGEENAMQRITQLYVSAYRQGRFQPNLMNVYNSGTMWPKLFLEDPDKEPTARSIGRPLRDWAYSILDDGIPLPEPPVDGEQEQVSEEGRDVDEAENEDDEDEDELIDVVEEDSEDESGDPLARLRGALEELHVPDSSSEPSAASHHRHRTSSRPKVVTEHIRRGTKLTPEDVSVQPLSTLLASLMPDFNVDEQLPLQLQPEEERLSLFLRILSSDTASIRAFPPAQLMATVALRWVVLVLHKRAEEHGFSKDKDRERWAPTEVGAFLTSFTWAAATSADATPTSDVGANPALTPPTLENRNIQLVAQFSSALDAVEMLAQALLLGDRVIHPAYAFSGQHLHTILTSQRGRIFDNKDMDKGLWETCIEGLQEAMSEERGKWGKKERKAKNAQSHGVSASSSSSGAKKGTATQGQGLFGMLVDLDEDNASV